MSEDKCFFVERFDAYTKTSFRHCLYHIRKNKEKLNEREIILDIDELDFFMSDEYSFLENNIKVMNFNVIIKNDLLYEALNSLEQRQRDIIYLSVCENLSDSKISKTLNLSRSSVQRIKVKVAENLRNFMTGDDYNGKK